MAAKRWSMAEIAALLGAVAAAGTALLYAMGWGFALGYYQRFGLGLMGIEIPKEFIVIWGGLTLTEGWVGVTAVLLLPAFVAHWRGAGRRWTVGLGLVGLVAFTGLAVFCSRQHGRAVAERQWADGLPGLPNVQITLVADEAATDEAWTKRLGEGCQRLLLQDKSRIWLIRPVLGANGAWPAVDELPQDKVMRLRLLPGPPRSCP